MTQQQLDAAAARLFRLLQRLRLRVVLAESCTGGLVSATLSRIPGISEFYCGTSVVYQNETKASWLGISPVTLESPGPVSSRVAKEMAERILEQTPHSDIAASITGHLGPQAPPDQDGLAYIAVALRRASGSASPDVTVTEHRLEKAAEGLNTRAAARLRRARQKLVASLVLTALFDRLNAMTGRNG